MMYDIKIFLLILSIVYLTRYCVEFLLKFFSEAQPEPIKIDKIDRVFIYLSISYIITFIIT